MIDRQNPVFSPMIPKEYISKREVRYSNHRIVHHEQKSHWIGLYELARSPTEEGLAKWESGIPAEGCGCQSGYFAFKAERPPDLSSPEACFDWACWLHNKVNEKLGRRRYSIEESMALWRHKRLPTERSRLVMTVAVGSDFRKLLEITQPLMEKYAARCDADFIALTNKIHPMWQLEKFRTGHFVEQYDEVLFLDADCIVRESCPSLFDQSCSLLMHDDSKYLPSLDWLHLERKAIFDGLGIAYDDSSVCLNSGVVYSRKSACSVWTPPPGEIPDSHTSEQVIVEQNAIKHGYSLLDSKFNWQWYFKDFEDGIENAQIIHLANCTTRFDTAKRIVESL